MKTSSLDQVLDERRLELLFGGAEAGACWSLFRETFYGDPDVGTPSGWGAHLRFATEGLGSRRWLTTASRALFCGIGEYGMTGDLNMPDGYGTLDAAEDQAARMI